MKNKICGVDVSKDWLDASLASGSSGTRFSNTAEGIAALAAFCRQHEVTLVAMEATGGYERLAFLLLWQEGVASACVNPRAVRRYAEAMGALEKTDRIDARIIARFAMAKDLQPSPPPSLSQQRLTAVVARLSQITRDMTVQKQRLATTTDTRIAASMQEVINLLARQARDFEREAASLIADDPLWQKLDQAFRQIKGVAGRTVARIMAEMPEIGLISNKAVAKLAGLAPIANDSGARQGKRHIRGGRSGIRSILFLIGGIARKHDLHLADFSNRLLASGKAKMVVRIALARKLLVILNAKARDARQDFALET